jgi:multidrug efflux system outer membrane protein
MRASKAARVVTAVAVAAFASGCPVGPNYQRPEIRTPDSYRGEVGPADAESLAEAAWWQLFGDPVLLGLVQESLRNNYDLKTAVARVEQAQAQVGVARAPLFPQLSYEGGAQRGKSFVFTGENQTFNVFLGSFNLAWELDVWGRIRRATEAAQAEMFATEEIRRGVMLTLVSQVAVAYFTLLELDLELEIARRTVSTFSDTLNLFTRRYQGGVGNRLAVERAAASLAQTEAVIPDLERQIVAIENRISVLVGRDPSPVPRGAPLIHQAAPPPIPPGLPSQLLERRPDVRQAEDVLISSNAQIGVAVANFFPRIGLTSLYGGQSTELSNLVKTQGAIWNVAGSLVGPIFTGGQNIETYRGQVAFFEQSKAQYLQSILLAFEDVSNTLTLQAKLIDIRAAQERAVTALQESVHLSLLRYDQGLANYYEVLEAEQQLFPAQNRLAQTLRDQLSVVVQLYAALGGGWQLTDEEWMAAGEAPAEAPSAPPTAPAPVPAAPAPVPAPGAPIAPVPTAEPVIPVNTLGSDASFDVPGMPRGLEPPKAP